MTALRAGISALALIVLLGAGMTAEAQERLAVRAGRIITGDAADLTNGVMLIENGRIKAIGSDLRIPEGYRVIDRADAVIAPGLIDAASAAGAPNDLDESEVAVERRACAADAVDVEHRDFGLLARHGVTSVMVLPGDRSLISGQGCALKTGKEGRYLKRRGVLRVNLSTSVVSRNRMPSSYADATAMLKAVLDASSAGREVAHFGAFAKGKLRGVVRVRRDYQIRGAVEMARSRKLNVALLGAEDLQRVLPEMEGVKLPVLLSAPTWKDPRRTRELAAKAEAKGLGVAFFAGTPKRHPDALRQGAIVAARGGLPRRAAVASITSEAAEIAGIGDRVGRLVAGHDADFIVLSGDLLDARSRLRETWIDGRRVHRASEKGAK